MGVRNAGNHVQLCHHVSVKGENLKLQAAPGPFKIFPIFLITRENEDVVEKSLRLPFLLSSTFDYQCEGEISICNTAFAPAIVVKRSSF